MSVTVKLSTLFHKYTDGQQSVQVAGGSPLECLLELKRRFPKMGRWLYDKQGNLRPQIWLFVNGQKIPAADLAKPLNDGDELYIVLAISGG